MSRELAGRAGSALLWRSGQLLLGKGIAVIRTVVLAALLAPEAFGLFAIAVLVLETVQSVTDLGMRPALVQQKHVDDRHYDAAFTVNLVRAVTLSVAMVATASWTATLFDEPQATGLIQLLALRPVLDAVRSIKVAELDRALDFRRIAILASPVAVVETVVAVALAPVIGVWCIVAGILTGASAGVVLSYVLAPYRPRLSWDASSASPLFRYGRWVFLTGLVGVAGGAVLQAVVSRQLGATQLGLWYLGSRLAFLANDTMSEVVRSVAFSLHARVQDDRDRNRRAFKFSLTGMLIVLGPLYGVLMVIAPSLVATVLGPEWAGTSGVIQILSVVGIIGCVSDAAMPLLEGIGRPRAVTLLFAVRSVVVVALIWWLAPTYGVEGAAAAWLAAEVAVQLVAAVQVRMAVPGAFTGLGRALVVVVTATSGAAGAGWVLISALDGWVGVLASVLAGGLVGIVLAFLGDRRLATGLVDGVLIAYPALAKRLRGDVGAPPAVPDPPHDEHEAQHQRRAQPGPP